LKEGKQNNGVVCILSNTTQIPSYAAFTLIFVCSFLIFFVKKLINQR